MDKPDAAQPVGKLNIVLFLIGDLGEARNRVGGKPDVVTVLRRELDA